MQAQEVGIKPTVKVIMKSDAEMLDEVMVVAYGTAKVLLQLSKQISWQSVRSLI